MAMFDHDAIHDLGQAASAAGRVAAALDAGAIRDVSKVAEAFGACCLSVGHELFAACYDALKDIKCD
jgi:hypothetical protein